MRQYAEHKKFEKYVRSCHSKDPIRENHWNGVVRKNAVIIVNVVAQIGKQIAMMLQIAH